MKVLFRGELGNFVPVCHKAESPYPVVLFFPGGCLESDRYQWLGERLVQTCNVIYVTTDTLVERSGIQFLVPFVQSDSYPTDPSPALIQLFDKLKDMNEGVLAGCMQLDRIVVGGHSMGGSITIVEVANEGFFPNVVAGFSYGSRLLILENEKLSGTPLKPSASLLWLMGNLDGVTGLHKGKERFNDLQQGIKTIFDRIESEKQCYYAELDDFNHMCMADPEDITHPFSPKDGHSPHDKTTMRNELFHLISMFVREHAWDDNEAAEQLERYLFEGGGSPFVKNAMRKK